ncbi:MAG TPA: GNAT family N-acetyltransferase [Propionibacteriaceae bacterium]|nr:GNAT family N-acetyltransferase [Propionibacteriaceae bacterium]
MDCLVEGVLNWAPLARTDLAGLLELREAIDYLDDVPQEVDLEHLVHRYDNAVGDPAADAVVGRDLGGTVVAYGWNVVHRPAAGPPQVWIDGGVHPGWRHQGIGSHIVAWQLARCEEWLREAHAAQPGADTLWVGASTDERVRARSQVLAEAGFAPEHWYHDLRAGLGVDELQSLPVALETRHGRVAIERFGPEFSDEARLLHNEVLTGPRAHSDGHSDAPATSEEWELFLHRPASRPQWSWVAVAEGHVVGYVLNSLYVADSHSPREGWTDRLGVAYSWRGQGVGAALLRASQHAFASAGLEKAGVAIDTDDPERDLGAFHASGYRSIETVALYSRALHLDGDRTPRWEAPGRLG